MDKASKGTAMIVTVGSISVVQYSLLDSKQMFAKKPKRSASPSGPRYPAPQAPSLSSNEIWARGLYDFQAEEAEELSFNAGDVMRIIEQDPEWWVAEINGKKGFVPANYVTIMDKSKGR